MDAPFNSQLGNSSVSNATSSICDANVLAFYKEPFGIGLLSMYSAVFGLGCCGNALVLACMATQRRLRTPVNLLLTVMAVGDLISLTFCMPFWLLARVYLNFVYGTFMCKFVYGLTCFAVSLSIGTLTAINMDQLVSMRSEHLAHRKRLLQPKRVPLIVMLIVVWSGVLATPVAIARNLEPFAIGDVCPQYAEMFVCTERWQPQLRQTYDFFYWLVIYLLPLVAMAAGYGRLRRMVNDNRTLARSFPSLPVRPSTRRALRLGFMLVLMFVLTRSPLQLLHILSSYEQMAGFVYEYVFPLSEWLSFSNAATNPLCYCFFSASFRQALASLKRSLARCSNQKPPL